MIEAKYDYEVKEVLDYLETDIDNCVYIYLDLLKYGLKNDNIRLWVSKEEQMIRAVVMKYYDGFQIYVREENWNTATFLNLVKKLNPERIAGNELAIKQVEKALASQYKSVYGKVFCRRKSAALDESNKNLCEQAGIEDIPEIVDVMRTEKVFAEQYSKEELTRQLKERFESGMGRSFIVRDGGKIVGHGGTFAEIENIAVGSGSVVLKGYRDKGYFDMLENAVCKIVCEVEKKDMYFFCTEKRQVIVYEKLFSSCASYGKLVKKVQL